MELYLFVNRKRSASLSRTVHSMRLVMAHVRNAGRQKRNSPEQKGEFEMVYRAPFGMPCDGEAQLELPEQKDTFEATRPSTLRQRSSRSGDIEKAQDKGQRTRNGASEVNDSPGGVSVHSGTPLDPATSGGDQSDSSSAVIQPTWPGPGFDLNKVLPGSVYLWACGEHDDGDEHAPNFAQPGSFSL